MLSNCSYWTVGQESQLFGQVGRVNAVTGGFLQPLNPDHSL